MLYFVGWEGGLCSSQHQDRCGKPLTRPGILTHPLLFVNSIYVTHSTVSWQIILYTSWVGLGLPRDIWYARLRGARVRGVMYNLLIRPTRTGHPSWPPPWIVDKMWIKFIFLKIWFENYFQTFYFYFSVKRYRIPWVNFHLLSDISIKYFFGIFLGWY